MGLDSVMVAEITNSKNQTYFDNVYKKDFEEKQLIKQNKDNVLTAQQIAQTTGHKTKNTQRLYVRLNTEKIKKVLTQKK